MHPPQATRAESDRVVLLDESGRPIGSALKSGVHHRQTPLHLAFSCYLLNERDEVLLTRRALTKVAWPGVWTNSFCGHPRPGEAWPDAVQRYGWHELGRDVTGAEMVVPDFRYRAVDPGGVVENEVCPVFCARSAGPLDPHPDEVLDRRWVPAADLGRLVGLAPWLFSPWFVQQVPVMAGVFGGVRFAEGAIAEDDARLVG